MSHMLSVREVGAHASFCQPIVLALYEVVQDLKV